MIYLEDSEKEMTHYLKKNTNSNDRRLSSENTETKSSTKVFGAERNELETGI